MDNKKSDLSEEISNSAGTIAKLILVDQIFDRHFYTERELAEVSKISIERQAQNITEVEITFDRRTPDISLYYCSVVDSSSEGRSSEEQKLFHAFCMEPMFEAGFTMEIPHNSLLEILERSKAPESKSYLLEGSSHMLDEVVRTAKLEGFID